jgi:sugar lactone lactonase YvrE
MRFIVFLLPIVLLFNCAESTKNETSEIELLELNEKNSTASLEFKVRALLGEGAFWNHKSQEFYWVDILGKTVNVYNPKNKSNRAFPLPFRVGTVVPQTDSTAVVALDNGIYVLNLYNNLLTKLSDVEEDIPNNRFNDGKCDPNGNLWVGSMRLDETIPAAALYKVAPDGSTTKMLENITISNGIVWTKDGETMYYIDTPTGTIRGYDFDKSTSTISNERIVVEVSPDDGYPDGMAIDEQDMLWVGLWNGNAVARYNPRNGKLLNKIEVPAHNVTACAFGGEDLDILYITTAKTDMTEEESANYPLAGSIFSVKPGVKGVNSHFFGTIN